MKKIFKSITVVQCLTIGAVILYLFWDYYLLADWKAETKGPLIRVDLLLIYPLILIGIVISFWQLFKQKKGKQE